MNHPSINPPVSRKKEAFKASAAAALAASLEWYDFFIYGTAAALVFNKTFFYTGDPVLSAINSFASVAVAFAVRPLGGIVAGHFGDRHGRKPVLVAAIALMAIATFLIGMTPDTEIVWLAPTFLVIMRIAQGLAIGAQWGGAMLLATEHAPANRRGFYGSFAQIGAPVGVLAGNVVFLILSSTLSESEVLDWAWRVPFWVSILLLGVGLYIHRYLEETPAFREAEKKLKAGPKQKSPVLQVIRGNGGTIIQAAGAFIVVHALFYATITGSLQFATVVLGIASSQVLLPVLAGAALQIVLMPTAALASDIFGRTRVYTIGLIGIGVTALPLWWLFSQATPDNTLPVWISIIGASVFISITYGPQAALFSEIFPPELRYSGASLGYQISGVFGGLTPILMVSFINGHNTNGWRFGAYLAALAALAVLCTTLIKKRNTQLNGHNEAQITSASQAAVTRHV